MPLILHIPIAGRQLVQAFSWMLVHSLWQGILLAVAATILMQVLKSASARLRYNVILTLLVFFVLLCSTTFIYELSGVAHTIVPMVGTIGTNTTHLLKFDMGSVRLMAETSAAYITAHASWLVVIWMTFFSFRFVRLMQGVHYLHKARNRYTQVTDDWQERFELLCSKLHINRHIRLLESAIVKIPMVTGHIKPMILIPAGLLAGIPVEQMEAVLLHELAHIRRHDYLINLLQCICEAIFFFNPGILCLSSLLRDEREHCCDDVALEQTGNKKEFIQALISFKEYALYARHAEVAFPGKKNQLLQRVSRIINNKNHSLEAGDKMFIVAGFLLLAAVLVTAAVTQPGNIKADLLSEQRGVAGYHYVSAVRKEPDLNMPALVADLPVKKAVTIAASTVHVPKKQSRLNAAVARSSGTTEITIVSRTETTTHITTTQKVTASRHDQEIMQAENDRQQAVLDRVQAEKDRQQADKDREQATKDRLQAEKNKEQARLDRLQADKDRAQAERDREQAMKDRQVTLTLQNITLNRL